MKQGKGNKKKLLTSALALTLAAAVGFGGTLAWQSVNQTALNEVSSEVNPGGRLHDDFDGENKDIYVENFTPENGGVPIYARVKLIEYLEIGKGAGLLPGTEADKSDSEAYKNKRAESLAPGAKIDDESTWSTYHYTTDPDEIAKDPFREYFTLQTGGKTVYMPTFNMNKDSLKSDINGTYGATKEEDGKLVHYADYEKYEVGDKKTDTEIWDADANTTDEGDGAEVLKPDKSNAATANVRHVENKEHVAAETETAEIKTMDEWLALPDDQKKGNYWVWDTDGWAYWANPISPKGTTGLLLDSIKEVKKDDGSKKLYNYYYGLKAVAQFCTAGDWGAENGDGFFNAKDSITPAAQKLLTIVSGSTVGDVVTLSTYQPPMASATTTTRLNATTYATTYFHTGDLAAYGTNTYSNGSFGNGYLFKVTTTPTLDQKPTIDTYDYEVEGATSSNTKVVDAYSGLGSGVKYLQVGSDETAKEVTIVATSKSTGEKGTKTVTIGSFVDVAKNTPAGGSYIADGLGMRVLVQDSSNKRTLTITNSAQYGVSDSSGSTVSNIAYSTSYSGVTSYYSNSNLRRYYSYWLDQHSQLKKAAKSTTVYAYDAVYHGFLTATDQVFPLTFADICGCYYYNGGKTGTGLSYTSWSTVSNSSAYTYSTVRVLPYETQLFKDLTASYPFLVRGTVLYTANDRACSIVVSSSGFSTENYASTSVNSRIVPCMWLDWNASL